MRPPRSRTTKVTIKEAGKHRVWVRTKDWVAQWEAPGTPGRFQVLINGKPLETTFGTVGAQWHWQDGGEVELPKGEFTLTLHDLMGFEGRCDAILFSRDPDLSRRMPIRRLRDRLMQAELMAPGQDVMPLDSSLIDSHLNPGQKLRDTLHLIDDQSPRIQLKETPRIGVGQPPFPLPNAGL